MKMGAAAKTAEDRVQITRLPSPASVLFFLSYKDPRKAAKRYGTIMYKNTLMREYVR
jgi:hypothetical protein